MIFNFISHRAIQILLFITSSVSLINCTYSLFVLILTIYDYYRLLQYACPMEVGKGLAISHAPPWSVDVQCSIALLIFIYSQVFRRIKNSIFHQRIRL